MAPAARPDFTVKQDKRPVLTVTDAGDQLMIAVTEYHTVKFNDHATVTLTYADAVQLSLFLQGWLGAPTHLKSST